jgi:hypothetical protein
MLFHLIIIYETVETETDTFCHFLLAERVDVHRLTEIIDDSQFGSGVVLGCETLGFTKGCPTAVDW